jgi:hypothetical protein
MSTNPTNLSSNLAGVLYFGIFFKKIIPPIYRKRREYYFGSVFSKKVDLCPLGFLRSMILPAGRHNSIQTEIMKLAHGNLLFFSQSWHCHSIPTTKTPSNQKEEALDSTITR